MMCSEYGPDVMCTSTGGVESTHRPAGSEDPWFCMACGATDHKRLHQAFGVAAPAPVIEESPAFAIGDTVRISTGPHEGAVGTIEFIAGPGFVAVDLRDFEEPTYRFPVDHLARP
jgi:hypothetical protein